MKLEVLMDKTTQVEKSTVKVLQSFINGEVKPAMVSHGVPKDFVLKAVSENTLYCIQLGFCEDAYVVTDGEYVKIIVLKDTDTGNKYVAVITEFFGYDIILSVVDLNGVEQSKQFIHDLEPALSNIIVGRWTKELTGVLLTVNTQD